MLHKENRLTDKQSFDLAIKRGTRYTSPNFIAYIIKLPARDTGPRAGIIVSKKISKKAVERNRIKRVIREALKQKIIGIRQEYDIVVLATKNIKGKGSNDIAEDLDIMRRKLKL